MHFPPFGIIKSAIDKCLDIYKFTCNKGFVSVKCHFRIMIRGQEYSLPLFYEILNKGNVPITITHCVMNCSDNQENVLLSTELPIKLEHGDKTNIQVTHFAQLVNGVKSLYVIDSLGRKYYSNKRDLKEINEILNYNKINNIYSANIMPFEQFQDLYSGMNFNALN